MAGKPSPDHDLLIDLLDNYIHAIDHELVARWEKWPIVIEDMSQTEVIAGLVRRQVSLAKHMAYSPNNWSPEFGPIVLRCMVELYIWIAWIFGDVAKRSKLFIEDGLGKEKLILKHRLDEIKELGIKEEDDFVIQESKAWIESQRYPFLVNVNLSGSWSGLDVRTMAEEAGCRDLYRFTYPPFSSSVHSTWNHISRYDLQPCDNPLHGGHRIPRMETIPPNVQNFLVAAKYLAKTFSLIDDKLSLKADAPSGYDELIAWFVEGEPEDGST